MAIEDKLVDSWDKQDRRSLLDLATGGRVKHGGTGKYRDKPGAIPPLSTTGKITDENLRWFYKRFFPDERPEFRGGPGAILEAISPAGIVKKANTASKMFTGWADNLTSYINTLSKKKRKKLKGVINRAFKDLYGAIDSEDIDQVQHRLYQINKDNDLHKFVQVPGITTEGIAGEGLRQAKKARGAPIQQQKRIVESPKGIEQRKTAEKVKKEARTGGEPKHQRGSKLVRKY